MTYPSCFNSKKQYEAWVALAVKSRLKNPRLSFCHDCSINYQRQMIEEGRCVRPDTKFITVLNEDEELEDIGQDAGD